MKKILAFLAMIAWLPALVHASPARRASPQAIDTAVRGGMARTGARGLALAVLGPTGLPWNWEYAPDGS
jgi:hypothetical protein